VQVGNRYRQLPKIDVPRKPKLPEVRQIRYE
jgi:hypothetical protein